MKKLVAIVLAVVLIVTFLPISISAAPKGIDFNGAHYNLNLIGKSADWKGGGSYDNPDRHTMFVPEDTTGFSYTLPDGTVKYDSIQIKMTQNDGSDDFAVLDGNAFDDGVCALELAKGTYNVYIVSRAKPGYSTAITGWAYYTDSTGAIWYALNVGSINVTRKWQSANDLFYVSDSEESVLGITADTWIFSYLKALEAAGYDNTQYFWDYDNNGNKLVQVRFYPVR